MMWYPISGALTFMVLAAALVTASFLMSPVIEDVFGEVNIQDNESFHLMKMKHFFSAPQNGPSRGLCCQPHWQFFQVSNSIERCSYSYLSY